MTEPLKKILAISKLASGDAEYSSLHPGDFDRMQFVGLTLDRPYFVGLKMPSFLRVTIEVIDAEIAELESGQKKPTAMRCPECQRVFTGPKQPDVCVGLRGTEHPFTKLVPVDENGVEV